MCSLLWLAGAVLLYQSDWAYPRHRRWWTWITVFRVAGENAFISKDSSGVLSSSPSRLVPAAPSKLGSDTMSAKSWIQYRQKLSFKWIFMLSTCKQLLFHLALKYKNDCTRSSPYDPYEIWWLTLGSDNQRIDGSLFAVQQLYCSTLLNWGNCRLKSRSSCSSSVSPEPCSRLRLR